MLIPKIWISWNSVSSAGTVVYFGLWESGKVKLFANFQLYNGQTNKHYLISFTFDHRVYIKRNYVTLYVCPYVCVSHFSVTFCYLVPSFVCTSSLIVRLCIRPPYKFVRLDRSYTMKLDDRNTKKNCIRSNIKTDNVQFYWQSSVFNMSKD